MKTKGWTIVIVLLLVALIAGGAFIFSSMDRDREMPPVITLEGGNTITTVEFGSQYQEPGFSARTAAGKDITDQVEFEVPIMRTSGTYHIDYKVTDDQGNSAVATRTIQVVMPEQTDQGKERGLAVLMYHDVYDDKKPPETIDANMISKTNLKAQLDFLVDQRYYFPTWSEVEDYLDGKIDLPEKSVVLTFDDATKGFIKYGAPLIEKMDVYATSFVITSKNGQDMVDKKYKHIDLESHSDNMHRSGGSIGHGGIFTALSYDEAVADLQKSSGILGHANAFAYPFGDYTDDCRKAVEDAGFKLAFTTENGKIHPGDDKLLLKRVRVNGDIALADFISMI